MRQEHLKFLVCPECKSDLELLGGKEYPSHSVESGNLKCCNCESEYPIVRNVPRFVPLDNYANNFGLEWTKHARTQYDAYSGIDMSEKRFFEETRWDRDLREQIILEVGSGSGRFTEQAASTGAMIVSMDYSCAVEANYASNGDRDNVLIVQAELYKMPFRESSFDKVFCFGVLQHTPDVRKSFLTLPHYLKSGGGIALDVYRKSSGIRGFLKTKYYVRPITKRMNPNTLYRILTHYIKAMWPICRLLNKLPYGRMINRALLIVDYRGRFDLKEGMLKEWALLDTFDALSPAYDEPQTLETVKEWLGNAGLRNIDVHYGYGGIEGHATKS